MKTTSIASPFRAGDEVYYYDMHFNRCDKYIVSDKLVDGWIHANDWVPVGDDRMTIYYKALSFTPYDAVGNGFTHERPSDNSGDKLDKKLDYILSIVKDVLKYILS